MGMAFSHPTALNLGVQSADGFHQELLRGLTHKLNNMLAIIQGFSSLILMSDEQDAATREIPGLGHPYLMVRLVQRRIGER